ncbi:transcription factor bHLH84-like [Trifolium medium]|uniref:Transcription factor bHLH84-like n=1 Tax=Trifolium medium TaxID=97028 RepID=A0A392LYW7_9FABA|nr:transcription factor bHLH84-like [Trifolium medium]
MDSKLMTYKMKQNIWLMFIKPGSLNEVPKNKRKVKCRKNMRCGYISTEENTSPGSQDQTLSSCYSERMNPIQKRRKRINERLRILPKLVHSGTKVDISTMLEEASNMYYTMSQVVTSLGFTVIHHVKIPPRNFNYGKQKASARGEGNIDF